MKRAWAVAALIALAAVSAAAQRHVGGGPPASVSSFHHGPGFSGVPPSVTSFRGPHFGGGFGVGGGVGGGFSGGFGHRSHVFVGFNTFPHRRFVPFPVYVPYYYPTYYPDRKSTRLNSSHSRASRMPSSA